MTLNIQPFEYYDQKNGGAIPIFKPTMEEFKDFKLFIESIDSFGKASGIVKVIPPKEWVENLSYDMNNLDEIKVTKPITQHIIGGKGIFTQTNIENRKEFTLKDWYSICHQSNNLPSHHVKNNKTLNQDQPCFDSDQSHLTVEEYKEIERHYWRNITFNQPMYGADMLGTLFNTSIESWNPNTLDNTLNQLNVILPGVNTPYLYFGMWKATFAWHVEDMDLYSINYIHFGAPKQWYIIQPQHQRKFENFMQTTFFNQYKSCHEFLRHKTFIVSPKILEENNIPVQRCIQQPGEFIITYPFGYHAGYNLHFNCAESVNFALDSWLEIGKKAKSCSCIDDSVVIDVNTLLNKNKKEDNHDDDTSRKKRKLSDHHDDTCILCSIPTNQSMDLLDSACGKYKNIHRLCAESINETYISKNLVYGIDKIPLSRWKLMCLFCKEKKGACMQCCYGRCWKSFHATCAAKHQATMNKLKDKDISTPQSVYDGYCPQHDPKRTSEKIAQNEKFVSDMIHKLQVNKNVETKWRGGGSYKGVIKECDPNKKVCKVMTLHDGITRKIPWRDIITD